MGESLRSRTLTTKGPLAATETGSGIAKQDSVKDQMLRQGTNS